jgi:hypothetical protein
MPVAEKGLSLSIETPAAVAALPVDAGAGAEAQEQNRELIARVTSVLFAAVAVFFASIVAVLMQLR